MIISRICTSVRQTSVRTMATCPWTRLKKLNGIFLNSYAAKKAAVKTTLGDTKPIIILHNDDLMYLHQRKKEVIRYVPEEYHRIKNIAHIACLIQVLKGQGEGERELLHHLRIIQTTPEVVKYRSLLQKYMQILETGRPELHTLKPDLHVLIKEAAIVRTNALHSLVQSLERRTCPHHWNKLAVIIMGPHMPREGELGVQYAKTMILAENCPHQNEAPMNNTFQGKRLVYAESIDDVNKALDILVTEICDEELGEAILDDKDAMHADFLKSAVQEYLATFKGS